MQISQFQIQYTEVKCLAEIGQSAPEQSFNKLSRMTSTYQETEKALRLGAVNRVLRDIRDACNDGTAQCGPNSVCQPLEDAGEYEVSIWKLLLPGLGDNLISTFIHFRLVRSLRSWLFCNSPRAPARSSSSSPCLAYKHIE